MKSKKTKKKNKDEDLSLAFGDELSNRNSKARITCWLRGDVLLELRRRAKLKGIGYQTYMNDVLVQTLIDSATLEERIDRIEEHIGLE